MKERIEIKVNYSPKSYAFKSRAKSINMPYVDLLVKNLETGEVDQNTSAFLIDTGASVSIINTTYKSFIDNIKPFDSIDIKYGSGKVKSCPLYHIGAIIKGCEFELSVAYDEECPFLLLGRFEFLERNSYTIFDSTLNRLQIVRL